MGKNEVEELILPDKEGNKIRVGSKVAINRSGELVSGVVVKLKEGQVWNGYDGKWPARYQWRGRPTIWVKGKDGKVSVMHNPFSVLVIGGGE